MLYQEDLCNYYENLIREAGEDIIQRLVRSWIRQLQKIKRKDGMMASPDDSGLENLWDDVCVQIQGERSMFWNLYEDYLYDMIYSQLEKRCTWNELEILWTQTREFQEKVAAADDDCFDEKDPTPWKGIHMENLADWCLSELLGVAGNYNNIRIEEYINGGPCR